MTFEQKLTERVIAAQQAALESQAEAMDKLLDNKQFIETQRSISAKENELKQLNITIKQLNKIKPFVTNDGHKYGINVFPINAFGVGLGEVLGIIAGSRSAFTDELSLEYSAITGISMIEFREASDALGSTTYITKDGTVGEAIPTNLTKLLPLVQSIMLKMGIVEFNTSSLTQERIDLWMAKAELSVIKKKADFDKNVLLDSNNAFTMED